MMTGAIMMTIKPWEVWFASVRFEDSSAVKARPIVVTSSGNIYVWALKVTSHAPRKEWGEYQLQQWQAAGLTKPSTVRIGKRIQLEQRDMIHRIGSLDSVDIIAIQNIITSGKK